MVLLILVSICLFMLFSSLLPQGLQLDACILLHYIMLAAVSILKPTIGAEGIQEWKGTLNLLIARFGACWLELAWY